ncbi:uncharacterized protein LOC110462954 [Mizuhopecten yessoensis]|uniref:uncharacterized protein LOC110462954 n=1 Tax=Mizuhopecten yessoensis TaxID=6573 RepID=UPI000B45EE1E|nr:uncharacterized protein LOC110462954 [Mizuhopecten yessoensis]
MFEIRQFCVLLTLLSISRFADAVMCYSCASSSADNPCLVNWKALRNSRIDVETDNVLNANVKNCSGAETYCSIEKIESRGALVSYIRGCSDGTSFSASLSKFRDLPADNQTACGYQLSGYLICISLCRGNFCNGPTATAAGFTPNMILLVLLFPVFRLYKLSFA